jgi:hypothetical protein
MKVTSGALNCNKYHSRTEGVDRNQETAIYQLCRRFEAGGIETVNH